jgi:hypothetical protein
MVDGEQRSYAPQFARTRVGAERLRRGVEATLAHFPTLSVVVEKVSAVAAAQEEDTPSPAARVHVVHLVAEPLSTITACGLPVADVAAVAVWEVFGLSSEQCPECVESHTP